MSNFLEIIVGPMELWTAPVGEPMPELDVDPTGNWVLVGTSGDKNYDEDGVSISAEQTIELIRMLGATQPLKANRTEEEFKIAVDIADWDPLQMGLIFNGNAVTVIAPGASIPGSDEIDLNRGLDVTEYALVAKGKSAFGAAFSAQFEILRAVVTSSPESTFNKGDAATYEVEFTALLDETTDTIGAYKSQTAVAS